MKKKTVVKLIKIKRQFAKKTAGLRSGSFSGMNLTRLKVLVREKIFQFQDMLKESERYRTHATIKWSV